MKLHRTAAGVVLEHDNNWFVLGESWDELINRPGLAEYLRAQAGSGRRGAAPNGNALAPIGSQEVWAAGVTYYRSREARVGESAQSGASSFYDRVYDAQRPELFFKAAPWRVKASGELVRIRRDARWSVPEPELALVVSAAGAIVGYTIGNDMSSRDIEGENPLYLPQAKIYDGSCALGPAMLVREGPLPRETPITLRINRGGKVVFQGATSLEKMVRKEEELVEYLYREASFPQGCVLLTGTGVVPPDDFTLASGDEITMVIPPIGALGNRVA